MKNLRIFFNIFIFIVFVFNENQCSIPSTTIISTSKPLVLLTKFNSAIENQINNYDPKVNLMCDNRMDIIEPLSNYKIKDSKTPLENLKEYFKIYTKLYDKFINVAV
jgi:hypothetical protein